MKGIVFTEFLDMAEARFGASVVDDVIEKSELPNGGAYTAVGTYNHGEILRMVGHLSAATGAQADVLVRAFGEHLAGQFALRYAHFFDGVNSTFDFLPRVETYIHNEVRKLYPDAELPSLECERTFEHQLVVNYRSTRPFASLAEGLIAGTAAHFREMITIAREDLAPESGYASRFVLTRSA